MHHTKRVGERNAEPRREDSGPEEAQRQGEVKAKHTAHAVWGRAKWGANTLTKTRRRGRRRRGGGGRAFGGCSKLQDWLWRLGGTFRWHTCMLTFTWCSSSSSTPLRVRSGYYSVIMKHLPKDGQPRPKNALFGVLFSQRTTNFQVTTSK